MPCPHHCTNHQTHLVTRKHINATQGSSFAGCSCWGTPLHAGRRVQRARDLMGYCTRVHKSAWPHRGASPRPATARSRGRPAQCAPAAVEVLPVSLLRRSNKCAVATVPNCDLGDSKTESQRAVRMERHAVHLSGPAQRQHCACFAMIAALRKQCEASSPAWVAWQAAGASEQFAAPPGRQPAA